METMIETANTCIGVLLLVTFTIVTAVSILDGEKWDC